MQSAFHTDVAMIPCVVSPLLVSPVSLSIAVLPPHMCRLTKPQSSVLLNNPMPPTTSGPGGVAARAEA